MCVSTGDGGAALQAYSNRFKKYLAATSTQIPNVNGHGNGTIEKVKRPPAGLVIYVTHHSRPKGFLINKQTKNNLVSRNRTLSIDSFATRIAICTHNERTRNIFSSSLSRICGVDHKLINERTQKTHRFFVELFAFQVIRFRGPFIGSVLITRYNDVIE